MSLGTPGYREAGRRRLKPGGLLRCGKLPRKMRRAQSLAHRHIFLPERMFLLSIRLNPEPLSLSWVWIRVCVFCPQGCWLGGWASRGVCMYVFLCTGVCRCTYLPCAREDRCFYGPASGYKTVGTPRQPPGTGCLSASFSLQRLCYIFT